MSTITLSRIIPATNGVHDDHAKLPSHPQKIKQSNQKLNEHITLHSEPKATLAGALGPFRTVRCSDSTKRWSGLGQKYHQRRTLYQYMSLSLSGLWAFYNLENTAYRAAALGFLFPGAGLTSVATFTSLLAFVATLTFIPVTIFIWFAMGGIFFRIALWVGSSIAAGYLATDSLFQPSAPLWAAVCYSGIFWLMGNARSLNAAGYFKAQERNKYLVELYRSSSRMPLLRLPLALETYPSRLFAIFHDVIDQFQTGAVRYQLYGVVDVLSLYQCYYASGFHGYLSRASQNCIEKILQKKIMFDWKWESIFGRFTLTDWDPIKKDNIMVTGYLSSAIGLYEQLSGDRHYHQKNTLEFVIDDDKHYKMNYEGLSDALYDNMSENPYTLYPCEPNWIYSLCNLTSMAGLVISDRILDRDLGHKLRNRFERSLEEEFSEYDGRILPIRSEFTGLTLPGLCGTLTDCINAMLLTAYLPHLAYRNWAMIRKEFLKVDDEGQLQAKDLKGADKMTRATIALGRGHSELSSLLQQQNSALDQLDNIYFPVEATKTGSLRNKGLSATTQVTALMARLVKQRDLANATLYGPSQEALSSPLLQDAPFPEVLVAKAYSDDGKKLDLVLYNGKEPGVFRVGFERLAPGREYSLSTGGSVTANHAGKASVEVKISSRTQIILKPTA
ncbi:Fc.00g000820.m01.CDS01 [Cosmosporella sp. VM-42]